MRYQEDIRFTARDGLELQGYLTKPHLRNQKEKLPMVVLTHRDHFVGR